MRIPFFFSNFPARLVFPPLVRSTLEEKEEEEIPASLNDKQEVSLLREKRERE